MCLWYYTNITNIKKENKKKILMSVESIDYQ